jgi:hypothetical protein
MYYQLEAFLSINYYYYYKFLSNLIYREIDPKYPKTILRFCFPPAATGGGNSPGPVRPAGLGQTQNHERNADNGRENRN